MYTVSVRAHYDAAHFLRKYKGKCERMHGHRYVVEVAVRVAELNEAGIAFDFVDLKGHLRALAEDLDHLRPDRLTDAVGDLFDAVRCRLTARDQAVEPPDALPGNREGDRGHRQPDDQCQSHSSLPICRPAAAPARREPIGLRGGRQPCIVQRDPTCG